MNSRRSHGLLDIVLGISGLCSGTSKSGVPSPARQAPEIISTNPRPSLQGSLFFGPSANLANPICTPSSSTCLVQFYSNSTSTFLWRIDSPQVLRLWRPPPRGPPSSPQAGPPTASQGFARARNIQGPNNCKLGGQAQRNTHDQTTLDSESSSLFLNCPPPESSPQFRNAIFDLIN